MSKSNLPSQSTCCNSQIDSNDTKSRSLSIPISTRENRTSSAMSNKPKQTGKIKYFSREKGHGYITSDISGEDIFVHICDFEGEYVPLPGDEVEYRLSPFPPKLDKTRAVHVRIIRLSPEVHLRWSN